jgi:hypothetical protein
LFGQWGGTGWCLLDPPRRDWIGSANRDHSPIRSRSSHWRNSPLKPMLSAILKPAMTHLSICFPDFPAVSHVRRYSVRACIGGKQIGRARRMRSEGGLADLRQLCGSSRSHQYGTPGSHIVKYHDHAYWRDIRSLAMPDIGGQAWTDSYSDSNLSACLA